MTTVHLLFEWTEEREAKIHIGVFSTVEKAQAAAQIYFDADGGDEDVEDYQLVWGPYTHGSDSGLVAAKGTGRYADETPFEIEHFDLDTLVLHDWDSDSHAQTHREVKL